MWRLLWNLIFFWRANDRRADVRRGMRTEYETQRAMADASPDYFLQRDLARAKAEDKRKKT
jgi:hypothetical protein